jgi:hypothetical protein
MYVNAEVDLKMESYLPSRISLLWIYQNRYSRDQNKTSPLLSILKIGINQFDFKSILYIQSNQTNSRNTTDVQLRFI